MVGADESPGDEQSSGVSFGSGMAGARVFEDPWGEVAFESVDGGLEYAAVGVDATQVKISPTVLVDEVSSFGIEQRVDVLVYNRSARADVRRQFSDEVGFRAVHHLAPADQPLEWAAGVVEVPAEDYVAARGLPSPYEVDDDRHHGL